MYIIWSIFLDYEDTEVKKENFKVCNLIKFTF